MARRFTAHVALIRPDTQKVVAFAPGDDVPDWATVGDHVVEADPEPAKRGPGRPRKDAAKAESDED